MEKLSDLLDQLHGDNHTLTTLLLEKVHSFYRIPRLRRGLVKIPSKRHELSESSFAAEKDLVYLLSALAALSGSDADRIALKSCLEELSRYLRSCESLGVSIQHFLKATTRSWLEIRPKFQELSQKESVSALQGGFPKLKAKVASNVTVYLLGHNLLRVFPTYPFHRHQSLPPLILVRSQTDLSWNLAGQSSKDWTTTLYNHFPEFDWTRGTCELRKIWFLGVRVRSPLTLATGRILQKSLVGPSHLATTRMSNKRKLLMLAFYSEADVNLFKFNLIHYSKLHGALHEFIDADLSEYRKGYPGFSGFFNEKILEELP